MPRYIALLRAVNVGGRIVTMDVLRGLFEELGFTKVTTFIASGNVIFETSSKAEDALRKKIEAHLRASLGYEVATFLRTDAELAEVAARAPFTESELKAAASLNVGFLEAPLDVETGRALMALKTPDDEFRLHDRELHWLSRVKQNESKLTNVRIEKAIGGKITFRGVNSVRRLAAKVAAK
ncbi:MAG TPA: DUF1697 domain-containing protein [Holophagaceae bacterium]|nr:DUF1697 domain-containing protein [Holophagaceae bacterium]